MFVFQIRMTDINYFAFEKKFQTLKGVHLGVLCRKPMFTVFMTDIAFVISKEFQTLKVFVCCKVKTYKEQIR